MFGKFSKRSTDPELIDDFKGGREALQEVFDDINRANRMLGGNRITLKAVDRLIRERPKAAYTIADVGCGDGGMLRELADYFRKRGIPLQCIGLDISEDALCLARKASMDYPEIEYRKQDILLLSDSEVAYDIVLSTLCMHHFSDEALPAFLGNSLRITRIGMVVNDLHRSRTAYCLFWLFRLIFIKTKTAKIDGAISIKSGFSRSELSALAGRLPHVAHDISWQWAFRYLWVLRPLKRTE